MSIQSSVSTAVQSQNLALTASQQIVLRVLIDSLSGGERIKTVNHGSRMCEVVSRSGPLQELQPWFESDGKPSDSVSYWVLVPRQKLSAPELKVHDNILVPPIAPSGRKPSFRPPCWTGEPRPNAETRPLRAKFPSSGYLKYLVSKLGYDKRAAIAALPHSLSRLANSDRRMNGHKFIDGQPIYVDTSSRRTKVGGAFKVEAVTKIIGRHRWTDPYPNAVVRVLCQRQRPGDVAKELKVNVGALSVYASQIRHEIGLHQTGEATN